jgi:hypothetical protein
MTWKYSPNPARQYPKVAAHVFYQRGPNLSPAPAVHRLLIVVRSRPVGSSLGDWSAPHQCDEGQVPSHVTDLNPASRSSYKQATKVHFDKGGVEAGRGRLAARGFLAWIRGLFCRWFDGPLCRCSDGSALIGSPWLQEQFVTASYSPGNRALRGEL